MPLPTRILRLRENAVSLFVSNIPEDLAKPELEAMFWRAGEILDSSIPVDKINGKKQSSLLSDLELSRKQSVQFSWVMADHGGKKIQVQMVKYKLDAKALSHADFGKHHAAPQPFLPVKPARKTLSKIGTEEIT